MTVCIGILCEDGVVLAADSQVTHGRSHKEYAPKIGYYGDDNYCVGLAGSGYYDVLKESFAEVEVALGKLRSYKPENIQKAIQQVLTGLVRLHPEEMKEQALLSAIRVPELPIKLFRFWKNIPADLEFSVIGCGDASVTAYLQSWLRKMPPSTDEGLHWATFMVSQAKQFVPGCGGPTDALIITSGGKVDEIQRSQAAYYEQFMENVHLELSDAFGRFAVAPVGEADIELYFRALGERIRRFNSEHFKTDRR